MNKVFPQLLILLLIIILIHLPTLDSTYTVNGEFTYYFFLEGVNTRNPYDTFALSGIIHVIVEYNIIKKVVFDLNEVEVSDKPAGVLSITGFLDTILNQWITHFQFIKQVSSGEIVYTGIRDVIIKSIKVKTAKGYEIREYNTGVYLGGKVFFNFQYRISSRPNSLENTYSVTINTLIVDVQPHDIVNNFATVEPPIEAIQVFGGIIAFLILIGAGYTVLNWDKYNLDIFS